MSSRGPKLFTLLHPPMVCSQLTVSLSLLNPDLSTQPHSRSMDSVSNSPIRLSVPVPSLMVHPAPMVSQEPLVPTVSLQSINQQSPHPSQVESLVVLSAKSKRPLLLILKNQQSPRHLKYPRFQPLMTMPILPVMVPSSKVFLKHHLSRAAMVKHQLFLRCPLTQDLVDKRVAMASQFLILLSSHLSLQRELAATVAPATVVPRAASAALAVPRAAMALKATANPREEDSANPEVDMAAPEVDTVPQEVPLALPRVPLPPRAASADQATANPAVATANPEAATVNPRAAGVKTSSNPNILRLDTASPEAATASLKAATANPEVDMAAPEVDTAEAAREASADSTNKASEVKAAMALPEAVHQVMVVDMVESAPTAAVDMAVPDMEAQEDGEELSFCVYGLNA